LVPDNNIGPISTPISGYHVTDIGTPDIVPDINPDIRYKVYDISDMMTRYRVCTRYRYPISGHIRHIPISGQKKTRYRDTSPDIVSVYLIRFFLEIFHFFLEVLSMFTGIFLRLLRSAYSFSVGGTFLS
jgi:hypothetical protein